MRSKPDLTYTKEEAVPGNPFFFSPSRLGKIENYSVLLTASESSGNNDLKVLAIKLMNQSIDVIHVKIGDKSHYVEPSYTRKARVKSSDTTSGATAPTSGGAVPTLEEFMDAVLPWPDDVWGKLDEDPVIEAMHTSICTQLARHYAKQEWIYAHGDAAQRREYSMCASANLAERAELNSQLETLRKLHEMSPETRQAVKNLHLSDAEQADFYRRPWIYLNRLSKR